MISWESFSLFAAQKTVTVQESESVRWMEFMDLTAFVLLPKGTRGRLVGWNIRKGGLVLLT